MDLRVSRRVVSRTIATASGKWKGGRARALVPLKDFKNEKDFKTRGFSTVAARGLAVKKCVRIVDTVVKISLSSHY